MPCVISDFAISLDGTNTPRPIVGQVVSALPTQVPLDVYTAAQGAYRLDLGAAPSVMTDSHGAWSLTLPSPSECRPNTVAWIITLPDGTRYSGTIPNSVAGPLSLDTLLLTYGWGVVSTPAGANIQTIVVAGAAGPPGAAGPDATLGTVGAVLIDATPGSGHPIAATKPTTDALLASTVTLSTRLTVRAVCIKDAPYNAVGDGVANDTAAINAALLAVHTAGGGTVHCPAGTYLISSTLTHYANTTLQGDGMGRTILRAANTFAGGASTPLIQNPAYTTGWTPADAGIIVRHLTFDMNGTHQTYPFAVPTYQGTTDLLWDHVACINPYGSCGVLSGPSGTFPNTRPIMRHCLVDGTGQTGTIGVSHYDVFDFGCCVDGLVEGCVFKNSGASCTIFSSAWTKGTRYIGNTFAFGGGDGFCLEGCIDATISGCVAHDNTGLGIKIFQWSEDSKRQAAMRVAVSGCVCHDNVYGIGIGDFTNYLLTGQTASYFAVDCSISNCILSHNQQNALFIQGVTGLTLVGNSVMNNAQSGGYYAITFLGQSNKSGISNQNVTIVGNTFADSQITPTQLRGIEYDQLDYLLLANNSIAGITAGNMWLINPFARGPQGTHNVVRSNPGYNPVGALAVTPLATVGSGVEYQDGLWIDRMYYITGGTVTAIAVGPAGATVSSGLTSGGVFVPAGAVIRVTFSGSPTWTAFGN